MRISIQPFKRLTHESLFSFSSRDRVDAEAGGANVCWYSRLRRPGTCSCLLPHCSVAAIVAGGFLDPRRCRSRRRSLWSVGRPVAVRIASTHELAALRSVSRPSEYRPLAEVARRHGGSAVWGSSGSSVPGLRLHPTAGPIDSGGANRSRGRRSYGHDPPAVDRLTQADGI